jgi:hypothetical protein
MQHLKWLAAALAVLVVASSASALGGRFRDRPTVSPRGFDGRGRIQLRIEDRRRGLLPWRTDRRVYDFRFDPRVSDYDYEFARRYRVCPCCGR